MRPTQKIPSFRQGQALTAETLNNVVSSVLRMIVSGRGISVKPMGNKIEISADGQGIPRTGGGGTQVDYTEASRELLDAHTDVVVYARGRVTSGDDNGTAYIRNPDNDGWVALNRLE